METGLQYVTAKGGSLKRGLVTYITDQQEESLLLLRGSNRGRTEGDSYQEAKRFKRCSSTPLKPEKSDRKER